MGADRQGKTFLVIEDSADDAILIRRAFNRLNACRAFICRNLSEAKAYLRGAGMYQNREEYPFPNAILSDLHIGFESGLELLKWVKTNAELSAMPVIILTGTASSSDCLHAKNLGALEVLRKPTRLEDLQQMLADLAAKLCT